MISRFRSLVLAAVLFSPFVLSQPNHAAASDTPAPPLGSRVFDWNDLAVRFTNVGERRDVTDGPTATLKTFECHITTLNPGRDSHPQHQHAREEFIILKEGTVDVIINGEAQRAGPGSLFFFASNDFHSLRNVGDTPATYLVFNLETAATNSAPSGRAVDTAGPDKLASQVFDWEKLAVRLRANGEGRAILDSPTVTCRRLESHATTLNPGVISHAAHRHPDEELIIVKEGLVEAAINGVAQTAGPGSIFFFASNDLHGLRNAGDAPATYHVVRIVTDATPPG